MVSRSPLLKAFLVLWTLTEFAPERVSSSPGDHPCVPEPLTKKPQATLVTAFFDLGREDWRHFRRPLDSYLNYSAKLLQLNIPMVIYADPKIRKFVEDTRRGKEPITLIYDAHVTDLEYYKLYYRSVSNIMASPDFRHNNAVLYHPEGFSPEYNIVTNSKINLVHQVAQMDPFDTKYFFWFDFGYGHGGDIFPETCNWTPKNILDSSDQITYISLGDIWRLKSIFDIYKRRIGPALQGGFFGGSKKAIAAYNALHKESFRVCLEGNVVDDDQTMAVVCWLKNPHLFRLIPGSWYDAFRLFY